jgi:hypothetical protein
MQPLRLVSQLRFGMRRSRLARAWPVVRGFVLFVWFLAGPFLIYIGAARLAQPDNAPVTCNGHEMHPDETCELRSKQLEWRSYDQMKAAETRRPTADVIYIVVGSVVTIGGIALCWYALRRTPTSAD